LDRPEHIGNRTEFGHWESDSIESKNRKNSINVLVERVYRYVHITKLDSKKACDTANAIINKLSKHPEHFCQSITYDNGSENAQHQKINIKLKTLSYFCQPYRSWEKGAVEQANGLIRRFFPKKTDFSEVSWGEIKKVENLLNSRPKKCLDFKNHKRSIIRYVVHLQLERGLLIKANKTWDNNNTEITVNSQDAEKLIYLTQNNMFKSAGVIIVLD